MAEHCYCHNCCHWLFPPAIGSGIYKEHGDCLAKGRGAVSDPTYSCEQWGAKPVCGHCRDCCHWARMTLVLGGTCNLSEHDGNLLKHRHAKAYPLCVEDKPNAIFTLPDFGCVQWEAKND